MKPSEKLALSLEVLRKLQNEGHYAFQSKTLSRTHRERLLANGFIQEVIKGWYIPSKPDEQQGESTAWYASFWNFISSYLMERFDTQWCLSPEQSLLLHAENWTVPTQLLVRVPKGSNRSMELPHKTSLFQLRLNLPPTTEIDNKDGLQIYALIPALINCSAKFFVQYPVESRAILGLFTSASELLHYLLEEGHSTIASRLCGAFRNIGKTTIADEIKQTMESAGYNIREEDPFKTSSPFDFATTTKPPYCSRLAVMWHNMREQVIHNFPSPSQDEINKDKYLTRVDKSYTNDAYHSLSIEGYQVNAELIEKVRSGNWNPDVVYEDRNHRNDLAARGYWQAFSAVKKSLTEVLNGENPGLIVRQEQSSWYRELFQPSVTAGILRPTDLAGFRRNPVYIRQSKHIPPRAQIVSDLMNEFFDLISEETHPAVRVVLGHFFFVYIHPYPDGNGRIGRFLMNVMCCAGRYPWTIIPVDKRNEYMQSLELASVEQDIIPFTQFLAECIEP